MFFKKTDVKHFDWKLIVRVIQNNNTHGFRTEVRKNNTEENVIPILRKQNIIIHYKLLLRVNHPV